MFIIISLLLNQLTYMIECPIFLEIFTFNLMTNKTTKLTLES